MKTKVWNVSTWQRVIYVMYGLEHGLHYSEMDWIRDKPEMGDVIKKIAWLNLSKMPAGTTSSSSFVANFNSYWEEILKKQIELYDPEIIVFGNTFSACRQLFVDMDLQPLDVVRNRDGRCFINVFKDKGRLLIGYWPHDIYEVSITLLTPFVHP